MAIRKGDMLELGIEKAAFGGQGVAKADGLVVFVRGGVPGDIVRARVFKKKKGYAEAGLVEILRPSPDRVEPPCPYAGFCGGCQWQQIGYPRQLEYKRQHVQEALEHIGGLRGIRVHPTIPSGKPFGYRNKMEFSFSGRRWFLPHELEKRAIEPEFALGLHVPGTFSKIIDVDACLLQEENGNRILRQVKAAARDSGIPAYETKTHRGFWRFLMLRYSVADDEWMVNIITSEDRPAAVAPIAAALDGTGYKVRTFVNNIHSGKAAVAVGEREVVYLGDGYLKDRIGPFSFRISANSFFQTNPPGAERLFRQAAEYAEVGREDHVLDLYSGTGTIPIFLASRAASVTGIELSRTAVLDAEKNCRENGVSNCRFLVGDARKILPEIGTRPDVLVIDPPRAGMHRDVASRVLELAPRRIVYISCNPATMARDLALMADDYQILEIQPVDMFPQTYHVEAVAKVVRKG